MFAEGPHRTRARGGESYHNYGLAIDVIPINIDGSVVWKPGAETWGSIYSIAHKYGFEDIGSWDPGHLQMTFGLSIDQLQNGERP